MTDDGDIPVVPTTAADIEDAAAEYARLAIDETGPSGVSPVAAASALERAAEDIRAAMHDGEFADGEPGRSEPADFGGGESTGVQEL